MKISELEKIENKDYIVLLPKIDYDIKESVEYSFDNVFYMDYELNKKDIKKLIDFINNNLNKLIIFDLDYLYRAILPYLKPTIKVKWVYKSGVAAITNGKIRETFTNIVEFYDRDTIDEIVCLDKSTFEILKNSGYNVRYITLDIDKKNYKTKKSSAIGIIGDDYNPNHNTYNQLSAVKLVKYSYVKINSIMPATKHFLEFFNIKNKLCDNLEDVISDNDVNLYCNFTCTNFELILKSMDRKIPCIVGNTDFFDNSKYLKEQLVLSSDDDINEIAIKIDNVRKNKEKIIAEYEKFRTKYSKESKKQIKDLLK